MKFTSIRLKVILLVLAMAIPIVLLGIAGTLYYQSVLKQNIQDNELTMAKTISVMTPEYMNTSQLYLKSIADRPLVIKAMEDNDTAFLHSMAVYSNQTDRINSAYFTDNKGNVIASTQNISSMIGSNVKDNSYVGDVLRTGDPVIGDAVPGNDGMPVVPIGVPIKDDNATTLGTLVGTVDLNVYSNMIRETAVNDQQVIYLVNRTGHIMIHNNPQYVRTMENFSSVQSVQNILQGETGVADYYNPIENVSRLGAYVPIEPMRWGVIVTLPTSVAYKPAVNAGYLFVGGTALLTLGAILLGLFLAGGITSPILRLSSAANKISNKSDYSGLIPLDRKDEIGDLSRSFKDMVDDLQTKQEELETQTEELEVQNEEIRENNAGLQKQIQEREKAEEALRESEEKYRIVAENTYDWAFWQDTDGKFLYSSPSCQQITGYSGEEFIKDPDLNFKIIFNEDLPAFMKHNSEEARHGKSGELVFRIITKDGKIKWIHHVCRPVLEKGRYVGTRGSNRDITERKNTDIALYESEERFRALADNIPNLAWMADAKGWIFWYNKQWYDYTGTTLEEMQGWGWQKVHHPDYVDAVTKEWSASIAAGKPYDNIFPLKGKDGNYRWFLTRINPIRDEKGNIVRWFGTNTDITERKEAEEVLHRQAGLIDLSPDGIIVRRPDGEVIFWSKGAQTLYGWTAQEVMGQNTHTLFHTKFPQPLEDINQQLSNTGRWSGELVHTTKDGRQVVVQSWWMAQFDRQGNIIEILESNVDITERKKAEDEVIRAKAQAELYLDLMGHDISNMHQIIMGQLELAQEILETDCKLDAVDKTLIDTSLETLDRSAKLIDNVRNLQKLSHGEFREEVIDLDGLLSNVIREFDSIVPDGSIKLVSNELHYVKANKLLHDVFTNLIGNAIKHSNKNNIDITIKVDNIKENGKNYYRVSIEDNGPGISDDIKVKVFNRLQRGKTEARGVGLGLYLVKTLVESYGGFVKVDDRVRGDYTQGAKFLVYLPMIGGELLDE